MNPAMNAALVVVHELHTSSVFYGGPFVPRVSPLQRYAAQSVKGGLYMMPPPGLQLFTLDEVRASAMVAADTVLAALLIADVDVANMVHLPREHAEKNSALLEQRAVEELSGPGEGPPPLPREGSTDNG